MERVNKKVYIWGSGDIGAEFLSMYKYYFEMIGWDVLGYIDSSKDKQGSMLNGVHIFAPTVLKNDDVDYVIASISDKYMKDVKKCILESGIDEKKIKSWREINRTASEFLGNEICHKYINAEQNTDLRETLLHIRKRGLSVYNQWIGQDDSLSEVFYDDMQNMPYILFEDKRMYFPPNTGFYESDGKKYVKGILREQVPTSPHLYVKEGHSVEENSVIVDAGVCEGNFALRYVERAKKMYLIESNPKWWKPLEATFEPFKDKVVLCKKYMSGRDGYNEISLDSLVEQPIDFLKADIEGYEVDMLLGGKRILERSNAKISLCSYHRHGDEETLSWILNKMGYKTSTSKGYMVFVYDPDMYINPELRKGIVYGWK